MAVAVKMRPLSERQYAKETFRASQAALSYPEKVRQLVMLQERLRPIYAARGRIIVPWTLDRDEAGQKGMIRDGWKVCGRVEMAGVERCTYCDM